MVIVMDMSSGRSMDMLADEADARNGYGTLEFIGNARRDPAPAIGDEVPTGSWSDVARMQVAPRLALVESEQGGRKFR